MEAVSILNFMVRRRGRLSFLCMDGMQISKNGTISGSILKTTTG
jgi:hypothetical protein